jgi:hypothetical protein
MSDFDIKGARMEGYSDAEIVNYLGLQRQFDVNGARQAGYSDKEILDHLAPGPSFGRRVLDTVGDAAGTAYDYARTQANKQLLGPVIGLPRALLEGVDYIGKKDAEYGGTGARVPQSVINFFPTAQQATDTLNKPSPSWEAVLPGPARDAYIQNKDKPRPEVNINPVVDAGVGGLLSLPFTGGTTLPAVFASVGGPVASEIAGKIAEGTPYEVPSRIGGLVAGAAGGLGAGYLANKAINTGKALVEPFRETGRDAIVGRTLNKTASNPVSATAALDAYTPPIPGFQLDAGRASRDPGLMALSDVVPDRLKGVVKQQNNALLTDKLDTVTAGLPPATDAGAMVQNTLGSRYNQLVKSRKTAVDPLYDAARNSPTVVDPVDPWLFAATKAEATEGIPARTMRTVQRYFERGAETPARMMAVRDAVNALDKPGLDSYTSNLLGEIRRKIDAAMATVPEEQLARSTFAQYSKPLEPFDAKLGNQSVARIVEKDQFGKGYLMPPEKVTSDLSAPTIQKVMMAAGNDPMVKSALTSAFFDDFRKHATSSTARDAVDNPELLAAGAAKWLEKNRGAAANVLTPDQVRALDTISEALTQQVQQVPGRVNSFTYSRLATDNILSSLITQRAAGSSTLGILRKALGFAYDDANNLIMDRLFVAIQNPTVASALMKKATPGNIKMAEPVLISAARASIPAAPTREQQ